MSVAEMLTPLLKIYGLDRVQSQGQILTIPYLGCDGQKLSRGLSLKIAYLGRDNRKVSRGGRKI